jgi:Domain of unknown function (DUF4331)
MSDHFSGPRALAGPAGDICDVYAFPSADRPGRIALAMTVLPLARPDSTFSDAIVYRFRLRPLEIDKGKRAFTFGPEESELVFSCTFEEPRPAANGAAPVQDGCCELPDGDRASFHVGDESGGRSDRVRVFAGPRSDPFFIDLPAMQKSMQAGKLAFERKGRNSLAGFNALGLVVEFDGKVLPKNGGPPLFAVVAETVVTGKIPIRLERMGRPEIKNHLLSTKQFDQVNRGVEVRDLYNLEDAFHMSKDYRDVYRARLTANLYAFDRLDGKVDWPQLPDGSHPLTDLLLADYLVMDVSKPYADNTWFEIERTVLEGRPHETCGGRSLKDESMTTFYTLVVNAFKGPQVSDGVHQATKPTLDVFPYMAPPNPALSAEQVAAIGAVLRGRPTETHAHR